MDFAPHKPLPAAVPAPSRKLLRKALEDELSDAEALDLAASIATGHSQLRSHDYGELRSLLAVQAQWRGTVELLAGEPRRIFSPSDLADSSLKQARIASEAVAAIWDEELLPSSEVAQRLGARSSNREKVNSHRRLSRLLGLPREGGRMYLYPAFQIDPARQEIYPAVCQVNQLLDAASDPWGTASWWISDNARLGGRPLDLVGEGEAPAVVGAAEALLDSLG